VKQVHKVLQDLLEKQALKVGLVQLVLLVHKVPRVSRVFKDLKEKQD
jgi:hypothetical protein